MSVKNGIVTAMVMPNGWHYLQPLKDGKTHKIEADSYDQLEKTVLRFRLEQIVLVAAERADPEHVSEDIKQYICANFPTSCVDRRIGFEAEVHVERGPDQADGTAFGEQTFRMHMPLLQRIAEWFGTLSLNPPSFVTPSVADKRANICAHCPENRRWQTTCGPCVQQIRVNSVHLLGHRATRYDSQLAGCKCFGHLNQAAVWLQLDPQAESGQNVPNLCWHRSNSSST